MNSFRFRDESIQREMYIFAWRVARSISIFRTAGGLGQE